MFNKCFREYCNFTGRSSRSEYWIYTIIACIINDILIGCMFPIILMASNAGMISDAVTKEQLVNYFISSPCFLLFMTLIIAITLVTYPALSVSVRRLHDIGKSAWWLLINFIPCVGQIWFIVLMLLPGEVNSNEWGENPLMITPKYINQIEKCGYYYNNTIKNYFNFSGITSIEEYYGFGWTFNVIALILSALCFIIGGSCFGFRFIQSQDWMITSGCYVLILFLWGLFLIIPGIALIIRRLRDTGYSPWFALLILASNIGQYALYVILCQPSKDIQYKDNINY